MYPSYFYIIPRLPIKPSHRMNPEAATSPAASTNPLLDPPVDFSQIVATPSNSCCGPWTVVKTELSGPQPRSGWIYQTGEDFSSGAWSAVTAILFIVGLVLVAVAFFGEEETSLKPVLYVFGGGFILIGGIMTYANQYPIAAGVREAEAFHIRPFDDEYAMFSYRAYLYPEWNEGVISIGREVRGGVAI